MPIVSERQRRAMYAAAKGHSNIGIPKDVAETFIRGDSQDEPDLGDLNDYEAAEAVRDGELPSPTHFGDFDLFDLRITGTGAAYRDKLDEYGIRDPEDWCSDDFVKRCNGLAVIFEHPEESNLNTQEYRDRAIGSIVLPYVKGDEVWGIAKIFDADAAALMQTTHCSTSPGVQPPKGSAPITLESGAKVLDEGLPQILDHLAICEQGVWDKEHGPEGVRLDARKVETVAEKSEEKSVEELEKERDDAQTRVDEALMKRDGKRKDDDDDKKRKDRKGARKDGDEDGDDKRKDAEESEKESEDDPDDEERHDEDDDAKKRKDAGVNADANDRKDDDDDDDDKRRDKKSRRDEVVDPNAEKELHDSRRRIARLEKSNQRLEEQVAALHRQPTIDDRNALATAYHRADSAFQMHGEAAPANLPGESPIAYRMRLADALKRTLPESSPLSGYKIVDSMDTYAFGLVEDKIYTEAEQNARNPVGGTKVGHLQEVRRDENGKKVSRFYGDPNVWMQPFMPPVRQFLTRINNFADQRRG